MNRLIGGILLCILALIVIQKIAIGAQGRLWSEPENVSNTEGLSIWPEVIADPYGFVHLFWSEEIGPKRGSTGNSIFYSRWKEGIWTEPNDILFKSESDLVAFPAVAIDTSATIHLVWRNYNLILYSNAPAHLADSAHAWMPIVELANNAAAASFYPVDIAVDPFGVLFIVYATRGEEQGVYVVKSADQGASWFSPILVDSMREVAASNIRLASDGRGHLHVVWSEALGYSEAVYYSRSEDGGSTWLPALTIATKGEEDYKADWITVTAVGDDEIHLVWMDGPRAYTFHQRSMDGGHTWTAPQEILTDLVGESGYATLCIDSLNKLHLFVVKRTRVGQIHGLYHSVWEGDRWSPSQRVAESSLWLTAAIVQGNRAFAFSYYENEDDLFLVAGELDAPHLTPVPIPTSTPQSLPQLREAVEIPMPDASPKPTLTRTIHWPAMSQTAEPKTAVNSLLIGVAPAVFLVAVIVFLRVRNTDRR